ncbi:MAG: hypothetical protein F4X14_16880 [Caldilineaceae bacterium SB0661_bin_32]|uniref:Uncharacterized protein n=1 Tax=Caldilineaceae bacterium SB0661_bin_32 TaxID=2605255 RepID=A0A6B1DB82_9CHLR|nr:hypothetical protein [Caldilineaceae bacterium SB0661_bin_32]
MDCRIGIIGDGPTDLRVIGKLAECIVSYGQTDPISPEIFELRQQNLRTPVDRYWERATREEDYHIASEAGKRLQMDAVALLWGAVEELKFRAKCDSLSYRDMIVLSTDAEKRLNTIDGYFEDYAIHLAKVLMVAVEKLYHQMVEWGIGRRFIPTIVPLPLFPSTEIIVAAARENSLSFRGRTARELKSLLYNVNDMSLLSLDDLDRQALAHITTESLDRIFRFVPEVRYLVHTLIWRT